MELVRDGDAYTKYAATFQCLQIAALNEALKSHGLADPALRRAICASYTFEVGAFIDQGWFREKGMPRGLRIYPVVGFAERPIQAGPEGEEEETGPLYLPDGGFEFHDYAHGSVGYYFEEQKEKLRDVRTGSLGD